MSYTTGVTAVINHLQTILAGPPFVTVVRGWKADADLVQNMPTLFIVCRADSLQEQAGARAENRRLAIDLYTINNTSHDRAIELAGAIIDKLDPDLTWGENVAWARLQNVEFYINVLRGFSLHWSRVAYEAERRRARP